MLDINPRTYCTKEDKAKGRKEKSSKRGEHIDIYIYIIKHIDTHALILIRSQIRLSSCGTHESSTVNRF